ncbi:MAG: hypothetical protein CMF80_03045 [Candidatus Marinimicrobia bacterium]|nr:hypothetical protein [Candidatus Neomarinimicrobiota bacterium]
MIRSYIIFCLLSLMYGNLHTEDFNLKKFMGKWYVISHIPNFIEKGGINSFDEYTLNEDSTISVFYQTIKDGKSKTIKQLASVDDYKDPTKWTIKFVKPWIPFIKAPYKIAYIDYRHQNVAVISNNYAWVMSRSKTINQEYYNKILNILETSYGFNKNEFVKIIQQ